MGFDIVILSIKGMKAKNKKNEDSCGFQSFGSKQLALVVSDGMGGHKMGDRASKIVVNTVLGRSRSPVRLLRAFQLLDKIEKSHHKINALNVDAGATVVAVTIDVNEMRFYAVGDSLGLLISPDGRVIYRTFEHSVVGFATEAGMIKPGEAKNHDQSHVILNGLGFSDCRIESSLSHKLMKDETLVLCSDGLTELLSPDEICIFFTDKPLQSEVQKLFEKCQDMRQCRDYFDDLTLLVCRGQQS